MNEPATQYKSIWMKIVAGGNISLEDEQLLVQALQDLPAIRDELMNDARVHDLLSLHHRFDDSEADFVNGVMQRCETTEVFADEVEEEYTTADEADREHAEVQAQLASSNFAEFSSFDNHEPSHDDSNLEVVESETEDSWLGITPTEPEHALSVRRKRKRQPAASESGRATQSPRARRWQPNWPAVISTSIATLLLGIIIGQNLGRREIAQTGDNADPDNRNIADSHSSAADQPQKAIADTRLDRHRRPIVQRPIRNRIADNVADNVENQKPDLIARKPIEKPSRNPNEFRVPAVAKLVATENAIWRSDPLDDDLEPGKLQLRRGKAQMEFADGVTVLVTAPVEFELLSKNEMALNYGNLIADVPAKAIGFQVNTPNARVIDLGTEFEVVVNDREETEVEVQDGEVMVVPTQDGKKSGQRWHLTADGMDRAKVLALPGLPGKRPIASQASGPDEFAGAISVDGEMLEFDTENSFDEMCTQVAKRFEDSPNQAVADFGQVVKLNQGGAGAIDINGVKFNFGNLNDVMRFQEEMQKTLQQMMPKNGVGAPKVGGFRGNFVINGKKIDFGNPAEFQKLQQQMFGPLQQFGIDPIGKNVTPEKLMEALQKIKSQKDVGLPEQHSPKSPANAKSSKGQDSKNADEGNKPDAKPAPKKRKKNIFLIPGKKTSNLDSDEPLPIRLFGINWFEKLEAAQTVATGTRLPSDDKPIMCFRVLGQLDGFM